MADAKFKVGDLVMLKSGSPTMTVVGYEWDKLNEVDDLNKIKCTWFNDANDKFDASYPADALVPE